MERQSTVFLDSCGERFKNSCNVLSIRMPWSNCGVNFDFSTLDLLSISLRFFEIYRVKQ